MNKPIKPLEELLDSVRDIEGFPIGKDEDILALSDPPYYTACPNPYINDFINEYGKPYDDATDDFHREPFVGDVSEGKNDPIYRAFTYHTQVPHKAIQNYIEHYTEKGDIILDGFCGTGTTGVAAQLSGRNAIIGDISPYATFIASSCNDRSIYINEVKKYEYEIIKAVTDECEWMYFVEDKHNDLNASKNIMNFAVWSDYLICPYCDNSFNLWENSVLEVKDKEKEQLGKYACNICGAKLETRKLKRFFIEYYDSAINKIHKIYKQEPIFVNYKSLEVKGNKEKKLDRYEFDILSKIDKLEIPHMFPTTKIPKGDKTIEPIRFGITNIHHFYSKRGLYVLSKIYDSINKIVKKNYKRFFMNAFLSCLPRASKQNRYIPKYGNRHVGILSGTYYTPHIYEEYNIIDLFKRRVNVMKKGLILSNGRGNVIITNQSLTEMKLKNNSIDYVFTDPPFGSNIMYSELNFVRESWLKVQTSIEKEAIINRTQNKNIIDYRGLIINSFKEYYNVLKPNRWITVEFHNSKASVWNVIQDAITKVGFIIAHVAVLDKQKGTINQLFSPGAVSKDLVISAYKPKQSFAKKFLELAGEGLEEEFIKMHLSNLKSEPTIERSEQMLYSKLLAYYVQRSYAVKYDAGTFYKMLRSNFVEEDGYWFNLEFLNQFGVNIVIL